MAILKTYTALNKNKVLPLFEVIINIEQYQNPEKANPYPQKADYRLGTRDWAGRTEWGMTDYRVLGFLLG